MMIEELDLEPTQSVATNHCIINKINELVDTVNELGKDVLFLRKKVLELGYKEPEPAENVQPDYVTTTHMTDGHTKEYYGQNGASIVADHPLPAGYVITIRETETKGDNK